MEDPRLLEEGYFWLHRQQNGWPPLPEEMLSKADQLFELDRDKGMAFTVCGVPVQELTEREAKAMLVILMADRMKSPWLVP